MKRLFKKVVQVATAISLAASIMPTAMLTASATAEDKIVEHDWILNDDGSLRDGVEISAHYTKHYADGVTPDEEVVLQNDEITKILTRKDITTGDQGWYTGWLSEKVQVSETESETVWSGTKYYFQVDLGAVRNINEIGYTPYQAGAGNSYHWKSRIWLSNDPNFENGVVEVTNGTTEFTEKVLTSFTYPVEETKSYRYVRFRNTCDGDGTPFISAKKLTVKGKEVFAETDLLHDADGNLTATLTSGRTGYSDISELQDINAIADGKYEIVRNESGQLDMDKATSFVMNFGKGDQWIQADLGERKALTKVRALVYPGTAMSDKYFRRDVEVQASNDPSFASYMLLAKTDATFMEQTAESDNKWLEYSDDTASKEYRYIRIMSPYDSLGVTELQVNGYALCSANTILYTNIGSALMDNAEDTTKIRVSNYSNADGCYLPDWGQGQATKYAMPVNDRIKLVFDGNVDASTVTSNSLKISFNYYSAGWKDANLTDYDVEVAGDTIYIDPYNFESNATVTLTLTSDIKVGGNKIADQTLMFKTGGIAPLKYVSGQVIKNVAAGKNVYNFDTWTPASSSEWGANNLTDNHFAANTPAKDKRVIDLGNEYKIAAYGIAMEGAWWWQLQGFKIYMGESKEDIMDSSNLVFTPSDGCYGSRNSANKKLDSEITARYICLEDPRAENSLSEFAAYAYMPAVSENGVADAYFNYFNTDKVYNFKIEKDNASAATTIVVARFDGNRLVDVTTTKDNKIAFDNSGVNEDGVAYTVKAFVLDGTQNIKPLTEAVVY